MRVKKFMNKNFEILVMLLGLLIVFSIGFVVAPIPKAVPIVNTASIDRLNDTIDILIEEYYEEKRLRTVCEETVDRWANDARTRQEVKNEARRLKERAKKKGAKK